MRREHTLAYTPALLRSAAIGYCRIVVGVWFPLLLFALAVFVGYRLAQGDRSWVVGTVGAFVLLAAILVATLFVTHLRRATAVAAELAQGRARLVVADHGLEFESHLGAAKIPWNKVAGIRSYGRVLLLEFRPTGYSSVPTDSLDLESLEFIQAQVRGTGGYVA